MEKIENADQTPESAETPTSPDSESPDAPEGAPGEPESGDTDGGADPGQELTELRDRYLRVAAEYENFRKRTARERTELWNRAQADLVEKLLPAFDDLDRVSELDPDNTAAKDIIDGIELVERKLFKDLETAGLERVGIVGNTFDPNFHEALGMIPAESKEEDQTIGAVFQVGYKFGGVLVRPARVQVKMWQGGAE